MPKPADPEGAGDPQSRAALLQTVFGYMASQVINVAARLGIADALRDDTLLLVEPVLPLRVESAEITGMVMRDLNMLVNTGGRERTEAEFRTLFTSAGFRLTAVTAPLGSTNYRVIEGLPT